LYQMRAEPEMPADTFKAESRHLAAKAKEYPWFFPIPFPAPASLMDFLGKIPNNSRVVLEGDGNPREQGRYIRFHDWTNEIFPDRQIEFINHTFLNRMLEPDLAARYLNILSARAMPPGEIDRVCSNLGVSHFLAFSGETIEGLSKAGYRVVSSIRYEDFLELADLLLLPRDSLSLLARLEPVSIISPDVTTRRAGNRLCWEAEAGETYFVRYRYYPQFKALQGNKQIPVSPYHPFDDLPLKFMSVQAYQTGMLELAYDRPSVQ
jgi:hypothetical protein